MTGFPCESDVVNIVLVGKFNPSLFQPAWLAAKEIISTTEASAVKLHAILPELSAFQIPEFLEFQATLERINVSGQFLRAPRIRDFVAGSFSLLEHTPISGMGINRAMHFRTTSPDERDSIGRQLATPDAWPSELIEPKMGTLTMQGRRGGSTSQRVSVTIEPSVLLGPAGIYVLYNEHFDLTDTRPDAGASSAMEALAREWDASLRFAKGMAEQLFDKCERTDERHG